MKLLLKLTFTSILILFIIVSCSDDDGSTGIFTEPETGILGEWESTVRSTLVYFGEPDVHEYGENPFGYIWRDASGKWSLGNDTLYITYDSTSIFSGTQKYLVLKLDKDSLILGSRVSQGLMITSILQ